MPFGPIGPATTARLAQIIDPGLPPGNPLDVWGTGRDTEPLFAECLAALAADPQVAAVALAVDLVPELDGDQAYPRAMLSVADRTPKPLAVPAGLPGAVDPVAANWLRSSDVPVLEGTRSGLLALRHLLDHAERPEPPPRAQPGPRRRRWAPVLSAGSPDSAVLFDLLRDYGIAAVRARAADTRAGALAAAAEIGYPVVLKTEGIAHKSEVGGVRLGLALGLVRDAALGPLLVVGAGGILIEIYSERAVVLPPVTRASARVEALDINPLICSPSGAVAAGVLAVIR